MVYSVIEDYGPTSSHCGYCNAEAESSRSHGMWAYRMTVQDYQDLIDQGWRRSGCYMYKPTMRETCCPQYTIRMHALQFKPNKEQLRLMRKWEAAVEKGSEEESTAAPPAQGPGPNNTSGEGSHRAPPCSTPCSSYQAELTKDQQELEELLEGALKSSVAAGRLPSASYPGVRVQRVLQKLKKILPPDVLYTSACPLALAATLRKLKLSSVSPVEVASMLCNHINQDASKHHWSARPLNSHINFSRHQSANGPQAMEGITPSVEAPIVGSAGSHAHDVDPETQGVVAEDLGNGTVLEGQKRRRRSRASVEVGVSHPPPASLVPICTSSSTTAAPGLEIRTMRSRFIAEEFQLYKKYQMARHGDEEWEVSERSYKRFLVDTCLIPVTPEEDQEAPPEGYGSFHQQYRVNGRLVAVGVVDLLPRCLSSVYLFWDPEFASLAPGKFSALKEIQWVQGAHERSPALQYYYMGFYIHSCPKMRYKGDYQPSDLLCPEALVWVELDDHVRAALSQQRYVCLSAVPHVKTYPNLGLSSCAAGGEGRPPVTVKGQDSQDQADVGSSHQESKGEGSRDQAAGSSPLAIVDQLVMMAGQLITWGGLISSGILSQELRRVAEEKLNKWRRLVNETASNTVYVVSDFLAYA